jgi:hypothetical protein
MASTASFKEESLLCCELAQAHLSQIREAITKTWNIVAETQEIISSSQAAIHLAEAIRAADERRRRQRPDDPV